MRNMKKLRCIIFKVFKASDKNILKAASGGKKDILYRGAKIKVTILFLAETANKKNSVNNISEVLGGKTFNLEFSSQSFIKQ